MAVDGTTALVGNPLDDAQGLDSGAVYVYDTISGQIQGQLLHERGRRIDYFGRPLAISGTTAIVGAPDRDRFFLHSLTGEAFLFDVTTGRQIHSLIPKDLAPRDRFGSSAAISGNVAIVGSPHDDDNGLNSGSAYLFDVTTGRQLAKLLPDDGARGRVFGTSVGISGDVAIVGANRSTAGEAYLFDVTTGQQIAKLLPDSGDFFGNASFGRTVAISGDVAIVGSSGDNDLATRSGAAYLFDARTGTRLAKLFPDDPASFANFGNTVAISGNLAVIGAWLDDEIDEDAGAAYVFDVTTGQQVAKLLADGGRFRDNLGLSVSISGNTAVVGAPGASIAGLAYVFDATIPEPRAGRRHAAGYGRAGCGSRALGKVAVGTCSDG